MTNFVCCLNFETAVQIDSFRGKGDLMLKIFVG